MEKTWHRPAKKTSTNLQPDTRSSLPGFKCNSPLRITVKIIKAFYQCGRKIVKAFYDEGNEAAEAFSYKKTIYPSTRNERRHNRE